MRVLFLTTVLPRYKRMGGEVASQAIVDTIAQLAHEVVVVGYARPGDALSGTSDEVCVGERQIVSANAGSAVVAWLAKAWCRGLPYTAVKFMSPRYARTVGRVLAEMQPDVVVLDHVQMGWLRRFLGHDQRIVSISHNIEHEMYRELGREASDPVRRWIYAREARLIEKLEEQCVRSADQLWVLTRRDANYYRSVDPAASVTVLPIATPPREAGEAPAKVFDVGVLGSWTWDANRRGLEWFVDRVVPELAGRPSIRVAGRGAEWLQGRYSNVHQVGFVPDAHEFMAQARVVAIPNVAGGGIQIKTLDAIATGADIVATPSALRGIDEMPSAVAVASEPEVFARRLETALATPPDPERAAASRAWTARRRLAFQRQVRDSLDQLRS